MYIPINNVDLQNGVETFESPFILRGEYEYKKLPRSGFRLDFRDSPGGLIICNKF
jgi:hypothetical protein